MIGIQTLKIGKIYNKNKFYRWFTKIYDYLDNEKSKNKWVIKIFGNKEFDKYL